MKGMSSSSEFLYQILAMYPIGFNFSNLDYLVAELRVVNSILYICYCKEFYCGALFKYFHNTLEHHAWDRE